MSSATALAHSDFNSGIQFFSKPKIAVKNHISRWLTKTDRSLFLARVGDYPWTKSNKPVKSLRCLPVHMKQLGYSWVDFHTN